MSRLDEADLVNKFVSALTVFSERSAALETRLLAEISLLRNDVQQLQQKISTEHNTVSLPLVMEQQRMTMIELFRQIQSLPASTPHTLSAQQTPIAVTPIHKIEPKSVAPPSNISPSSTFMPQHPQVIQQPAAISSQIQKSVSTPPTQQKPSSASGFGDQFKLKEGEWNCGGCYVKNSAQALVCVCCRSPKHGVQTQVGDTQKSIDDSFKPQSFVLPPPGTSLFGPSSAFVVNPPPIQPILPPKPAPVNAEPPKIHFSFAPKPATPSTLPPGINVESQKEKDGGLSFMQKSPSKSSSVTTIEPKPQGKNPPGTERVEISPKGKPMFGGGAAASTITFKDFAGSGEKSSFLTKGGNNSDIFNVDPKTFKMFGGGAKKDSIKKASGEEEDDGAGAGDDVAPEEFTPDDAQFKRPDIVLPDLVDVKTGEENEEVLFSARCRLYRFHKGTDNKERDGEVKERGTGDMKLLKNRETGKVRCVMRREQVLKVCANFAIHSGFTVNNTKRGENVLTWSCKDFSDPDTPEGEFMILICRFKDVDTAKKFKEVIGSV